MPVNTAKVSDRRTLHFERMDQILAEATRLAAGPYQRRGNWSLGQICDHLARTIQGSLDGLPFTAPWYVRIFARLMKGRWLNGKMPAGFNLPEKAAAHLVGPEPSDAAGLATLRAAIERFQSEPKRAPSPVFGTMSNDDWIKLHCRHSELHLSFLQPGA